jgi:putative DNA primase/helicase
MGKDQSLADFLQRYSGYVLTGDVSEQMLLICWGEGANGKSTYFETMQSLLGSDYAAAGADELLTAKKKDAHPTELADLHGRRLIVSAEIDAGRRMNEGRVKRLTGGDTIKARRMKEDFWEFQPTHKNAMLTNHLPIIRGRDNGIWRRVVLLPWLVRFHDPSKGETGPAELQQDKDLKSKLAQELPGILNWAIQGCLDWQKQGLNPPASVVAATARFREESDELKDWIADRCERSGEFQARFLYQDYREWCAQNGFNPDTETTFGKKLTERGFGERRVATGKMRTGIRLKVLTPPPVPPECLAANEAAAAESGSV